MPRGYRSRPPLSASQSDSIAEKGKAYGSWADSEGVKTAEHKAIHAPVRDSERPLGVEQPRRVDRPGGEDATGEPVVELVAGSEAPPRVVGPGRVERGYREKISLLEREAEVSGRSLDTAALVERGSRHLLDRMERQLDSGEEALKREREASRRVCVMLGALQRDAEILREELSLAQSKLARLEAPKPKGLFQRLLGRA